MLACLLVGRNIHFLDVNMIGKLSDAERETKLVNGAW